MRNITSKFSGFTMVELVLAIALMGLLSGVLGFSLFQGVKGFDVITSRRATLAQARLAIDRMVQEIGLIESSADVIDIGSSTQFVFEYPNNTQITYAISGGTVIRNSDVLVRNVTALNFAYLKADDTPAADEPEVRSVRITLTLAAAHNQGNLTLRTQVYLRNTGGNYVFYQQPQ